MLNIIAALLANYLIVGPLHSPGVAGAETAVLPVDGVAARTLRAGYAS